jgi:deoxyuridine 5'-triphosphate nucleotidohydrolase
VKLVSEIAGPGAAYLLGYQFATQGAPTGAISEEDAAYLAEVLSEFVGTKVLPSHVTEVLSRSLGPAAAELEQGTGSDSPWMTLDLAAFISGTLDARAALLGESARGDLVLSWGGRSSAERRVVESWLGRDIELDGEGALRGVAALDVLGRLYEPAAADTPPGAIEVQIVHPDAVLPRKERISDSGYDLTLLYVKKSFGVTTLFGTGIMVNPPQGWYLDVVPRSSIIKLGYMLSNNVGVIDRSYRGEIFVPLTKIDPACPDLELPARIAQLIPRPIAHFAIRQKASLDNTERGAGGFGSSGR